MQYAYHDPANMLEYQLQLANIQPDVVRHIRQHPSQLLVLFTDHSLVLLRQAKEWYIDVTFDM